MKSFEMRKIDNNDYGFLILSTSYISPLDELNLLEDELKENNYEGKILIDLLLCNGISHNRFVEATFDGVNIDLLSIKVVSVEDKDIKYVSNNFYKNNPQIIDSSILPKAHCYLIKNGIYV